MPSKSAKQAHLMAAVAHNPGFAKKVGIPQSVGKDFNQADKGHKFRSGGIMKNASPATEKKHAAWMKSHGAPKSMVKEESAEAYKRGGKVGPRKPMMKKPAPSAALPSSLPAGLASLGGPNPPMGPMAGAGPGGAMKCGGTVKKAKGGGIESKSKTDGKMIRMAKGGSVGRGDGCATKGKTKTRIC